MDNIVNYLSLRVKRIDDEDPQGQNVFVTYTLQNNFDQATKLL
jgi:hypothetical protein